MIEKIYWNYYDKGVHLVMFMNGTDKMLTSQELLSNFTLGHLVCAR